MKKAVALFLALVMCLSLVACGERSTNSGNTNMKNDTNTVDTSKFSGLWGRWVNGQADYESLADVTFYENGTCVVDGKDATWEAVLADDDDSIFQDGFFKPGEVYDFRLYQKEAPLGSIRVFVLDGYAPILLTGRVPKWVKANNTKTIELTPDNWKDYLEIVEDEVFESEYITDEFGDFVSEKMGVHKTWSLRWKPKYAPIISDNYELHFELSYTTSQVPCEFDSENSTINFTGEPTNNKEFTQKISYNAFPFYYSYNVDIEPRELYKAYLDTVIDASYFDCLNESNSMTICSDFEVLRIAGNTTIEIIEIVD